MASADVIQDAAEAIAAAEALLITAGAGMSVDSGLPDFRSREGFWQAYPPLRKLGLSFEQMAQPHWFELAPEMAWAWYGHRQQLYRETSPHAGYELMWKWGAGKPAGCFVITSNVDGQFQKARFDPARILEIHGSIHRMQCSIPCSNILWQDDPPDLKIDMATLRARGRLPHCPECGGLARPNVLMFNDAMWVRAVKAGQDEQCLAWLEGVQGKRVVIVECGAGITIPSIRRIGESMAGSASVTLVRINPAPESEDERGSADLTIRSSAARGLAAIDEALPEDFLRHCAEAMTPRRKVATQEFDDLLAESVKSHPGGIVSTVPDDYLMNMKYRKLHSKAWQVKLPSGWIAWVERLDVTRLFVGMLAGLPSRSSIENTIRETVEFVRREFEGPEPVVIPPKVFDATSDTPILPPLRFAARLVTFESFGKGDGTWMNLIWFAEIDDDKSIKGFVEEALAKVDWAAQATPFEI